MAAPRRKRGKGSSHSSFLGTWWPVILGLAVTPLALRAANVFALGGTPWPMRLLYPFAQLLERPELGLSADQAEKFSHSMMYLQYPLEGLLVRLYLAFKPPLIALLIAFWVHAICVLLLWALATFGS